MTVSATQAWAAASSGSAVATLAKAYVNVPTAGNLLVACAMRETSTNNITIADTIGDSVSWSTAKGPITGNGTGSRSYVFWKVVGTPSGGAKTVTMTNVTANAACALHIVEYTSSVGGITWNLNGTPTSVASASNAAAPQTPDPGGIVCDANPSVVIGFLWNDNTNATAGTNWTKRTEVVPLDISTVEDRFVASAATFDPVWATFSVGSTTWVAIGVAFEATPAAGGFNPGWAYGATKTIGGVF